MQDPRGPGSTVVILMKSPPGAGRDTPRASGGAQPGNVLPTRGQLPGKLATIFSGAGAGSEAIPKCFLIWEHTHPGEGLCHPGERGDTPGILCSRPGHTLFNLGSNHVPRPRCSHPGEPVSRPGRNLTYPGKDRIRRFPPDPGVCTNFRRKPTRGRSPTTRGTH